MEKCLTPSYSSKTVFPPCQCKGMKQHKEEMVAAATAPLFLAQLLPVFLPTTNDASLSHWLPGNPETTGMRYGWDNGLHGRWSPSKWPLVIKAIHSHLCVNMKQKHIFCLISGTSYLTSWDLMCIQDVGNHWRRMNLRCLCSC